MTSLKTIEHRKEFLKCLNSIDYGKNRFQIFKDFLEVSTISLRNTILKSDELEKRYFEIIGQYKEPNKLAELLAITVMALEKEPCDFLGDVYMFVLLAKQTPQNRKNAKIKTKSLLAIVTPLLVKRF